LDDEGKLDSSSYPIHFKMCEKRTLSEPKILSIQLLIKAKVETVKSPSHFDVLQFIFVRILEAFERVMITKDFSHLWNQTFSKWRQIVVIENGFFRLCEFSNKKNLATTCTLRKAKSFAILSSFCKLPNL